MEITLAEFIVGTGAGSMAFSLCTVRKEWSVFAGTVIENPSVNVTNRSVSPEL